MTIASDDEIEPEDTDSDSELAAPPKPAPLTKAGKKRQRQKAAAKAGAGATAKKGDGLVDPTFSFDAESSNLGVAETQAVKGWDFKSESLPSLLAWLGLICWRSVVPVCVCIDHRFRDTCL